MVACNDKVLCDYLYGAKKIATYISPSSQNQV